MEVKTNGDTDKGITPAADETEVGRMKDICIEIGPKESRVIFTDHNSRPERFKKIFGDRATQTEIFGVVGRPLIENSLKGYNSTILSYGQTGTGKTYTMTGEFHDPKYYGLIPRIIIDIFQNMSTDTEITISYFEIYNEHVYDLIKSEGESSFEISDTGPLSNNLGLAFRSLSRYKINTVDQAMALLLQGDSKKMLAQTSSNERSSRSHTIFAIGLKFPHPNGEGTYVSPVLFLVDLAGSENLSKHKGNPNYYETRFINLSLHYLEQVLLALRRPNRIHVPYRNSLMTTFLKNSLGGSCITAVIATFSLAEVNIQETRQTCRFAVNVAYIKNELKLNEETLFAKKLEDLEKEVELLREQLRLLTRNEPSKLLTLDDKKECVKEVQKFIQEGISLNLPLKDSKKVKFCFHLLRKKILKMSEWEDQKESMLKSNPLPEDEPVKTNTVLNITEISVEKNWRNQKQPINLPRVNITYQGLVGSGEEKENENLSTGKGNSIQVTQSEYRLIETLNERKFIPRLPVEVNSSVTTYGTNSSEISLEQLSRLPKKRELSKSSSESRSYNDSSNELITLATSSEVVNRADVRTPSLQKVFERSAEKKSVDFLDEEVPSTESIEGKSSPSNELPLTGDEDVDEEIIKFYQNRYAHFKNKGQE